MICFGKTTMLASNNMLRLSCDFSIAYEHSDDEPIAFGTPAYWDDAIWTYCNSGYQVFGVYWKKMSHEKCSRITEHKKVWGLLGRPKGCAETALDFGTGRLYLGLAEENAGGLLDCDAPICFLVPKEGTGKVDHMWHLFVSKQSTLPDTHWLTALQYVVRTFPQVIALFYQCADEAALTIVCDNPEVIQNYFRKVPVPKMMRPHIRQFCGLI